MPDGQPAQYRKITYITYDLATAAKMGILQRVWNRDEMMADIADLISGNDGSENYGPSGDYQSGVDLEDRTGYGADPLNDDSYAYDPMAEADKEFAAMEAEMDAMFSYDPMAEDPLEEEARTLDAEAGFLENAPLRQPAYHNGLVYIVTSKGYE